MWALIASFVTILMLNCLNYIAMEIESPFGDEANDLPLEGLQCDFNARLVEMLHPLAQTVPDFKFEQEFHCQCSRAQLDVPDQPICRTQSGRRTLRTTKAKGMVRLTEIARDCEAKGVVRLTEIAGDYETKGMVKFSVISQDGEAIPLVPEAPSTGPGASPQHEPDDATVLDSKIEEATAVPTQVIDDTALFSALNAIDTASVGSLERHAEALRGNFDATMHMAEQTRETRRTTV